MPAASPVTNPAAVEFPPSPDHDAVSNGVPVVSRYTLDVATQAAPTAIVKTVDLGKPAVTAGKVSVSGLDTTMAALPADTYLATVKAEGPGGVSAGAVSDPFTVKPRAPAAPGQPVLK